MLSWVNGFGILHSVELAIWLEISSRYFSPYVFNFSKDITMPSGGVKAKKSALDVLRVVVRELELDIGEGEVGTHLICKRASTHVRGNGVSKDDKDTRGRWKSTGRVSDRYDSIELPYIDTKSGSCTMYWRPMHLRVERENRFAAIGFSVCCSRDQ
jgi:hypothetical protein